MNQASITRAARHRRERRRPVSAHFRGSQDTDGLWLGTVTGGHQLGESSDAEVRSSPQASRATAEREGGARFATRSPGL